MTIKLTLKRPNGSTTSWGNYESIEAAQNAANIAKIRVPYLIVGELIVEHHVSPLEAIKLEIPVNTVIRYAT